jgi:hypothetical protein
MNGLMIPAMQSLGVISPTKFAFFLTKNVVTAKVMKFTTKPPSEDPRTIAGPYVKWETQLTVSTWPHQHEWL